MVLSSENSGKYFTRRWLEDKNRCMEDSTGFTQAEKDYLEVSGAFPGDGDARMIDDNQKLNSTPLDPLSTPKLLDIRDIPGSVH